jgi:membrane protein implicated in regulation of membrane protease activity
MVELMYWHWLVLGLVLLIGEMVLTSFIALWFGLGAGLVGAVMWIGIALTLPQQIFAWIVASCVFTFAWFRWVKPQMSDEHTRTNLGLEAIIGQTGIVIRTPQTEQRGMVRFSTPLLGSDEWLFLCEQRVTEGDRVMVKEVSGNTLIVEKH